MIYIVDTHSWIEYFIGSEEGLILKTLIGNTNNKIVTLECCIAELHLYCLRENYDFKGMLSLVKRNSIILPLTIKHWLEGAKIQFELRKQIRDLGLIDAILIYEQKQLKCKIVTGDPHFERIKNVIYTGKRRKH